MLALHRGKETGFLLLDHSPAWSRLRPTWAHLQSGCLENGTLVHLLIPQSTVSYGGEIILNMSAFPFWSAPSHVYYTLCPPSRNGRLDNREPLLFPRKPAPSSVSPMRMTSPRTHQLVPESWVLNLIPLSLYCHIQRVQTLSSWLLKLICLRR